MKKKILLGSGTSAILATLVATCSIIFASDPAVIFKANAVAGYVGLLSIALFFVGFVFPKDL